MKWVLIITWVTTFSNAGGGNGGSGVDVTTWPTLGECFSVGRAATENFEKLFSSHNTASFSCVTSTGKPPTCGGTGMEPCR